MIYWKQVPLFRLLFPFVLGIIASVIYADPLWVKPMIFVLCLFGFAAWIAGRYFSYRYRYVFGVSISMCFLLLGSITNLSRTDRLADDHFHAIKNAGWLEVKLSGTLKKGKSLSYRGTAEVFSVRCNGKWVAARGKILLYFKKGSLTEELGYGDCLLLRNTAHAVAPPPNPYEFNYKRYLESKGIYDIVHTDSSGFINTHANKGLLLIAWALNLRDKLLDLFRERLPDPESFSVASALVLGYTEELDPELVGAYTHSGT